MFLHNINYDKFDIALGDTLIKPHYGDEKPFDAIVSNPPYSVNWVGSDDPTLINDDRFAPAGVLLPSPRPTLLSCCMPSATFPPEDGLLLSVFRVSSTVAGPNKR